MKKTLFLIIVVSIIVNTFSFVANANNGNSTSDFGMEDPNYLYYENFNTYASLADFIAAGDWTLDPGSQPDRIVFANGMVRAMAYDGRYTKLTYNGTLPEDFTTEFDFVFPSEKTRGSGETYLSAGYKMGGNTLEAFMNFESKTAVLKINNTTVAETVYAFVVGKEYTFKGVKSGNNYYVKIWDSNEKVPDGYTLTATDEKITALGSLSLKQYSANYPGAGYVDNIVLYEIEGNTIAPKFYIVETETKLVPTDTISTGTIRVVQNIKGLNEDGVLVVALVDTETQKLVKAEKKSFLAKDTSVSRDIEIDSDLEGITENPSRYVLKSFLWNNDLTPLRQVFSLPN